MGRVVDNYFSLLTSMPAKRRASPSPSVPVPAFASKSLQITLLERPELGRGSHAAYSWSNGTLAVMPQSGPLQPDSRDSKPLSAVLSCVRSFLVSTFMPIGYPDTVASEYFTFQVRPRHCFSSSSALFLKILALHRAYLRLVTADVGFHSSDVQLFAWCAS